MSEEKKATVKNVYTMPATLPNAEAKVKKYMGGSGLWCHFQTPPPQSPAELLLNLCLQPFHISSTHIEVAKPFSNPKKRVKKSK